MERMTRENGLVGDGPVVEWLEGSIMVQKVALKHEFKAGLCHATTGILICDSLCQPSSNGYLFQIREG